MSTEKMLIFIVPAIGLYWGLKWFYGKRDGCLADEPNRTYLWISISFALGLIFGTQYFGTKLPGSFFERNEYEEMFYVYLQPDFQTEKTYRAPALIRASIEDESDSSGEFYAQRTYYIEFAILPNGRKVYFYDNDGLEVDRYVTIQDDQYRSWTVVLTDLPHREISRVNNLQNLR